MTITVTDAEQIREIVILSAPRNGTNFLCECLGGLREVDAYFELFNPNGAMGAGTKPVLNRVSEVLGKKIDSARDPDLVRLFRQEPIRALDILHDIAGTRRRKCISYKVFPNQLQAPALKRLLNRNGLFVILLSRTRLDVYISYLKARQTNVWKNTPTQELDCTVDVDEFLSWAAKQDRWFDSCAGMVRRIGCPLAVFDYNKDIDIGKQGLMTHLKDVLATMGTKVSFAPEIDTSRFQRQDAKVSPFMKIRNGAEVEAELRRYGKYDYALDAPLTKHSMTEKLAVAEPEPKTTTDVTGAGKVVGLVRRIFGC